jgi:uncharacterized protein with PQ loop repeat
MQIVKFLKNKLKDSVKLITTYKYLYQQIKTVTTETGKNISPLK